MPAICASVWEKIVSTFVTSLQLRAHCAVFACQSACRRLRRSSLEFFCTLHRGGQIACLEVYGSLSNKYCGNRRAAVPAAGGPVPVLPVLPDRRPERRAALRRCGDGGAVRAADAVPAPAVQAPPAAARPRARQLRHLAEALGAAAGPGRPAARPAQSPSHPPAQVGAFCILGHIEGDLEIRLFQGCRSVPRVQVHRNMLQIALCCSP